MDLIRRLSPTEQVLIGCSLLYVIFSFLDWQQVCADIGGAEVCGGASEWRGVGVVAALLGIAVLGWEVSRRLGGARQIGSASPELVSVGLALLLTLFTVITFLTHNEARHWPSWIGLLLSIVIGVVALGRGRTEGVSLPSQA
jgi:hypothetical protein